MSGMEYNKGVLIPINVDTELFDEEAFEAYTENGFVRIHDEIYEVKWEVERGELDQINNVKVDDDTGIIFFETYHHNGCAHWIELVESRV